METAMKIPYATLASVIDNDDWGSTAGLTAKYIESTLGKAYCKAYQNPKNHLINFLNAYEVEKAFYEAYSPHLEFNEPDRHLNLYEGKGKPGTDFKCADDGRQIEAKYFRTKLKFEEWLDKAENTFDCDRGCDIYLVYVADSGESFVVSPADKRGSCRLAAKQIKPHLRQILW